VTCPRIWHCRARAAAAAARRRLTIAGESGSRSLQDKICATDYAWWAVCAAAALSWHPNLLSLWQRQHCRAY
jgi:hypothetical protein